MTTELICLTAITLFTALMWMPYTANVIVVRGIKDALGYPQQPQPLAPWAQRVDRAHRNAVDNLLIFALLILVAHVANVNSEVTALASVVYVISRIVHFFTLVFAVSVIKSLSFMVAAACQITVAISLLLV